MADRRECVCGKLITPTKAGNPRAHVCTDDPPVWADPKRNQPIVPMDVDETDHEHFYRYGDDDIGHSGSFCHCGKEEPEELDSPTEELLRVIDTDDPDSENWNGTGRPRPSASNVKMPPVDHERQAQAGKTRLLDTLRDHASRMTPALESAAIGAQQMADAFSMPTPQGSGPVRGTAATQFANGLLDQAMRDAAGLAGVPDPFSSPTAAAPVLGSATDQPETWRNSYGQYVIKDPRTGDYKRNRRGKPQGFTRATTFAKTLIDQFGIHQWEMRTVIAGLALRPDLVRKAQGLDVAADKDALQDIIASAKDAAGGNDAATDGTDFHTVTEWIDAGRMAPADAPEKFRPEAMAYVEAMSTAGLTTKPEWIERVLFTDRVGEDVAGTADRILVERNGQHVIGDVKSGKGVDLGQREIAMQLKHYAMAVNQFGLYKKTSQPPRPGPAGVNDPEQTGHWEPWTGPPVSEEYGIVMHVPLVRPEGTPEYCDVYRIDLRGVDPYAVDRAHHGAAWVRGWRKEKGFLSPYSPPAERAPEPMDDVMAAPGAGEGDSVLMSWKRSFCAVTSPDQANQLWQAAVDAGMDQATLDHYVSLARLALKRT